MLIISRVVAKTKDAELSMRMVAGVKVKLMYIHTPQGILGGRTNASPDSQLGRCACLSKFDNDKLLLTPCARWHFSAFHSDYA